MREIVVGFSKSKKKFPIGSMIIRLVEKTPFSHVYIKHNTKYNLPIIYQATGIGVNFISKTQFDLHHEIIEEFKLSVGEEAFDKYMRFSLEKAGSEYSHIQLLGMFLAKIFSLDKNPFYESKYGYVCSELVFSALDEMGSIKDHRDRNLITPKDLYLLIKGLS